MSIKSTSDSPPATDHAGSYITFLCADTHYALNVDAVKYITSIDAINIQHIPLESGIINRIFSFSDRPVVLYSFNKIVGSYSQVEESKKLIALLAKHRREHIKWMEALENSIKPGTEFKNVINSTMYAFGQWYDQYENQDEELSNILKKLDKPHKQLHSLAEQLHGLADQPDTENQDLTNLKREKNTISHSLLNLFSIAEARLKDMIKQVIIVLETNGKVFAIDLDNIEQMEEFQETHWLENYVHTDHPPPCYDGYFQKEKGELYVNINPNRLMH